MAILPVRELVAADVRLADTVVPARTDARLEARGAAIPVEGRGTARDTRVPVGVELGGELSADGCVRVPIREVVRALVFAGHLVAEATIAEHSRLTALHVAILTRAGSDFDRRPRMLLRILR